MAQKGGIRKTDQQSIFVVVVLWSGTIMQLQDLDNLLY